MAVSLNTGAITVDEVMTKSVLLLYYNVMIAVLPLNF